MKRRQVGYIFSAIGLLMIAASVGLTVYNLREEKLAGEASEKALGEIMQQIERLNEAETSPTVDAAPTEGSVTTEAPETSAEIPNYEVPEYLLDPTVEMPTLTALGEEYVGMLELPTLGLKLPVIDEWSYPRLKKAPCRYSGSVYLDDIVIMAHNYKGHFASLPKLSLGDEIYFTDGDGHTFAYEVVEFETLDGGAIDEMTAGEVPLTLFTCTMDGSTRFTVRCDRIKN